MEDYLTAKRRTNMLFGFQRVLAYNRELQSQLPSAAAGLLLYQRPEVASCRGDKRPASTAHLVYCYHQIELTYCVKYFLINYICV